MTAQPTTKTINPVRFLDKQRTRIGGHLVVFTGPELTDSYGEFFTAKTDYGLDWYPQRPLLYQHGQDAAIGPRPVGVIDTVKSDGAGIWVEAQLAEHARYLEDMRDLIEQRVLGWSSGTISYLARVTDDGEIVRWPIVEGSLTPTPAEPLTIGDVTYRAVNGAVIHTVTDIAAKAAYKSAGLTMPDLPTLAAAIKGGAGTGQAAEGGPVKEATTNGQGEQSPGAMEEYDMTEVIAVEERLKALEAELAQERAAKKAAEEEAAKQAAIEAAVKAEREKWEAEQKNVQKNTPAKRLPGFESDPAQAGDKAPRIEVRGRFDNLNAADMAYGYMLLKGKGGASEQFVKAMADKVEREGIKLDGQWAGMKSDELGYSTLANYGDEWVPDLWSSELWRKARQDNVIAPLFNTIEMPSNPYELPIEGTDPTVYLAEETQDEAHLSLGSGNPTPDSLVGTGKVQLSAKKLSLRVGFSRELVEDSIIPVLSVYREQAIRAMADAIDNVLLNGDTTATSTGNINLDDDTPAATAKYLAFDGLRHLPLVTTTANAVDAAGTPTLAKLREARATMAAKYGYNPRNLAWVVDFSTYMKLLDLDEVVTVDKLGPNATVLTGQLAQVDGIPVLVSAEMPMTEADGKVSKTANNNTKGQGVLVYRPGWVMGFRRQVVATAKYFEEYDAYQLFAHARIAFNRFDADVAAALYDITV